MAATAETRVSGPPGRDSRPRIPSLGAILFAASLLALIPTSASWAQERDTVFDEAGVLTNAEEREVQRSLDEASASTEEPHYVFFVENEGVPTGEARRDFLRAKVEEAGAPDEAGVIVVAPRDEWARVSSEVENAQSVYETMRPGFQDASYAEAVISGANRISDDASAVPEAIGFGTGALLFAAVVGGALLARKRLRRGRELASLRRAAEEEFGLLRERMLDFTEKERLVSGYLEAQRAHTDSRTEEEVEKLLDDAGSARFGAEFNEASSLLLSRPGEALAKIRRGNDLLDGALESLDRAEETLDLHRKSLPKTHREED